MPAQFSANKFVCEIHSPQPGAFQCQERDDFVTEAQYL